MLYILSVYYAHMKIDDTLVKIIIILNIFLLNYNTFLIYVHEHIPDI